MKKINKFFLMGTVALSGMVGFSSCSSENDVNGEENGKNNPTEGVVKAQFALNVPTAAGNTRMSNMITQQDKIFRGMQNMRLLTFGSSVSGEATSLVNLGKDDDAFESDKTRRIYRDINIPVGTENFVFYGSALGNVSGSDNAENFKYGYLEEKGFNADKPSLDEISFALKSITSDESYQTSSNRIATILNTLLNEKLSYTIEDGTTETKKWSDLTDHETDPQLKHSYNLYVKFTGLKAGSWNSVKAALESLQKSIGATPAVAPTTFVQALANKCEATLEEMNKGELNTEKFPSNLNLPDGVAVIEYNSANKVFSYPTNYELSAGNKINRATITYPASLNYYVNSPVIAKDDIIDGLTGWPTYSDWTKYTSETNVEGWGNKVLASTRSIGLKCPIQYSVANLQSTIKAKTTDGTLKDNEGTNIAILVNNDNNQKSFQWTGILVGGQPNSVKWNYVSSEPVSSFTSTIYDNNLSKVYKVNNDTYAATPEESPIYLSTTESRANNTLVLDNKAGSGEEAEKVYVTLEFVNNSGVDFTGVDGVIPAGAKFYLVGQLVAKDAKNNGTTAPSIFSQDYTTKATFTISSLKNAYNDIPDLRSSQISLGLAVDLEWKTGMEFDVVIE